MMRCTQVPPRACVPCLHAGLHHAFENWRKPFNPILGETWQAQLSDGTCMFMEQISHHPPVSAFHMEGPGEASAASAASGVTMWEGHCQPAALAVAWLMESGPAPAHPCADRL